MISAQTRSGRFVRPLRAAALGAVAVLVGAVLTSSTAAWAAPSVNISRTCGPEEVGLTVSGGGLAPGDKSAWIHVERPNGDNVDSRRVPVDGAGNYTLPFGLVISRSGTPLPSAVRVGLYTSNSMVASVWYFIGCAGIKVDPMYVERKSEPLTIAVALTGFLPNVPVRISIPGLPTPPAQLPGRGGNRFTFPDYPGCGVAVVTATQATVDERAPTPPVGFAPRVTRKAALAPLPSPAPRLATASMAILCSTLTATPSTFADTALPRNTTTKGVQFAAGTPIALLLDGKQIGTANADKNYNFTQSVRIPRTSCGGHRLTAMQTIVWGGGDDKGRLRAAAPITISVYAETTIVVTCAKADLTVSPSVTEGGRLVQAMGAKFVPGRTVKLEWVDAETRPIADAGTLVVDGAGGLTFDTMLMPNSDLGARRLHAVEQPAAGDTRGVREGYADLLVVPSSMERGRGRFLERG